MSNCCSIGTFFKGSFRLCMYPLMIKSCIRKQVDLILCNGMEIRYAQSLANECFEFRKTVYYYLFHMLSIKTNAINKNISISRMSTPDKTILCLMLPNYL